MEIFNIDDEFENIESLECENINLINEEISLRNEFFDNLDSSKSVVIIGSGPTLNKRINRKSIQDMFRDTISDDFYIVPVNDKWIYCDEYDFSFCVDETFVYHYNYYNKDNNLMITPPYLYRFDYSTPGNLASIPYSYYKNQSTKILCLFQTGGYKIKNHKYDEKIGNLKTIPCNMGGSTAIHFFYKNNFKNIYLVGFGGTGYTHLVSNIPRAQQNHVWKGSSILTQNFKEIYQFLYDGRNSDGSYENFYTELRNKYPDMNLYFAPIN